MLEYIIIIFKNRWKYQGSFSYFRLEGSISNVFIFNLIACSSKYGHISETNIDQNLGFQTNF